VFIFKSTKQQLPVYLQGRSAIIKAIKVSIFIFFQYTLCTAKKYIFFILAQGPLTEQQGNFDKNVSIACVIF
jgi:hypothetical protein